MSVGLEFQFFFRLKPFQISKIFANIDMISGIYKKFFSGKQWKLKKLYLSILGAVSRKKCEMSRNFDWLLSRKKLFGGIFIIVG